LKANYATITDDSTRKGLLIPLCHKSAPNLCRLKKNEEKHCFRLVLRLNEPKHPATKGGEIKLKFLKMIMIMAVLLTALGLGACAQHKEVVTPAPAPMGK
jgi:hypothetical protein